MFVKKLVKMQKLSNLNQINAIYSLNYEKFENNSNFSVRLTIFRESFIFAKYKSTKALKFKYSNLELSDASFKLVSFRLHAVVSGRAGRSSLYYRIHFALFSNPLWRA